MNIAISIVKILFNAFILVGKLTFTLPGYLYSRSKSRHAFKEELIKMNIDETIAKDLAKSYGDVFSFKTFSQHISE